MQKKIYFIKNKHFDEIYKISQELHGNISIIRMFCRAFEDIDDFYQILPILNHTYNLTDKLYAKLINIKK